MQIMAAEKGNKYAIGNRGGRPTKYDAEKTPQMVYDYIDGCEDEYVLMGDAKSKMNNLLKVDIPTIEGLCIILMVSHDTIAEWVKKYNEFSDAITKLKEVQKRRLLEGGLSGEYQQSIAKLILANNHGMSDKVDQNNTGNVTVQVINYADQEKETTPAA